MITIKYGVNVILFSFNKDSLPFGSKELFISLLYQIETKRAYINESPEKIGGLIYIEHEYFCVRVPNKELDTICFDGDLDKSADVIAFVRNLLSENEKIVIMGEPYEEIHEIGYGITGEQIKKLFFPDYFR